MGAAQPAGRTPVGPSPRRAGLQWCLRICRGKPGAPRISRHVCHTGTIYYRLTAAHADQPYTPTGPAGATVWEPPYPTTTPSPADSAAPPPADSTAPGPAAPDPTAPGSTGPYPTPGSTEPGPTEPRPATPPDPGPDAPPPPSTPDPDGSLSRPAP